MTTSIEYRSGQTIVLKGSDKIVIPYPEEVSKTIIERKGVERFIKYANLKKARAVRLKAFLDFLRQKKSRNLKVLEVGCSFGQVTELLQEQDFISEIYCYDIDSFAVNTVRLKMEHMGLDKVKYCETLTSHETINLPFDPNFFDVVLVYAIIEHIPTDIRTRCVDQYYRCVKEGGHVVILETPNRDYFFERHSLRLPFAHRLSEKWSFIYAKLFKRLGKEVSFPLFVRAGGGWRNASYAECLPQAYCTDVTDISRQFDYGYPMYIRRVKHKGRYFEYAYLKLLSYLGRKIGFPVELFISELNLVFEKKVDYENAKSD